MQVLLDRGAEVNARETISFTALHLAAANGHKDTVQVLLDRGAEVNALQVKSYTALHLAAANGHTDTVQVLLDRGAEVNARVVNNWTALHFAAQNGHMDTVQVLLDRGAEVNARAVDSCTALHIAAQDGHKDTVQVLLDRGAEVNAQSATGESALHLAALLGRNEVLRHLVHRGADVNLYDAQGNDALYYAVEYGVFETVQCLLDNGAAVKKTGSNSDENDLVRLLYLAATSTDQELNQDRLKIVKSLIADSKCAPEEWQTLLIGKVVNDGKTVFGQACHTGCTSVANYIMEKCDTLTDCSMPTALWHAANAGHNTVAVDLFRHGHVDNVPAPDGTTPLTMAITKGHMDVVDAFLHVFSESEITKTCAQFGSQFHRLKAGLSPDIQQEVLINAIESDDLETVKYIQSLCANNVSADSHVRQRQSVEMLKHFRCDAKAKDSALLEMSREFPSFNTNVEDKSWTKWSSDNINIEDDLEPKILGDFCCIEPAKAAGALPLYAANVDAAKECEPECTK